MFYFTILRSGDLGQYCALVEFELGYSWFSGGIITLVVRYKHEEKGEGDLEDNSSSSHAVSVENQE